MVSDVLNRARLFEHLQAFFGASLRLFPQDLGSGSVNIFPLDIAVRDAPIPVFGDAFSNQSGHPKRRCDFKRTNPFMFVCGHLLWRCSVALPRCGKVDPVLLNDGPAGDIYQKNNSFRRSRRLKCNIYISPPPQFVVWKIAQLVLSPLSPSDDSAADVLWSPSGRP